MDSWSTLRWKGHTGIFSQCLALPRTSQNPILSIVLELWQPQGGAQHPLGQAPFLISNLNLPDRAVGFQICHSGEASPEFLSWIKQNVSPTSPRAHRLQSPGKGHWIRMLGIFHEPPSHGFLSSFPCSLSCKVWRLFPLFLSFFLCTWLI